MPYANRKENTIYQITCKISGKIYIGKTAQRLEQRLLRHQWDARRGMGGHLGAAIRKYGWENFSVDVVARSSNRSLLDSLEIFCISFFNSHDRTVGYNLTAGGDGVSSESLKEAWANGRYANRVVKPNSGQFKLGGESMFKGKTIPPETRKIISEKVSKSLIGNKRRLGIPDSDCVRRTDSAYARSRFKAAGA